MSFPILQPSKIFNPLTDAPGLFAWYNANLWDGYPSNNSGLPFQIGTLSDLTGNGYEFSQGTGAAQPTVIPNLQNGHPGVVFTSASDLVGSSDFLSNFSSGIFTIYMVMQANASSSNLPLIAVDDDLFNRFNFIVPNQINSSVYIDYGNVFGGQRLLVSEPDIYDSTYAHCFQTNTPAITNFRNNVLKGTNNNCGTFTPGIKVPHIGWSLSDGFILFEMLCCNEAHDSSTRSQIFSYLNNYWRYE